MQICEDGSVQIKIIKRAGRSEVRDVISYRFNTRKNLSSILFVCQHRDKGRLWTERRRGSDVGSYSAVSTQGITVHIAFLHTGADYHYIRHDR